MVIKSPTKKQLNVFIFGLDLILIFFSLKAYKAKNINLSLTLAGIAVALLIIYLIRKDFVIQFYKAWMRCASVIGIVISGICMVIIFYLVFTPVGIFLRFIRKDVLHLRQDKKLKTYWLDKPQVPFEKSNYERQF